MSKIESLKNIHPNDFLKLSQEIYDKTSFMAEYYPNYKNWFFEKQIPRVLNGHGEILFVRVKDNIIAVTCLKKEKEEQKICTLYVSKVYRGNHLGTELLAASMCFLGTTKPFITFAETRLPMFQSFIEKYDWKLTEIVHNNYQKELCFNGYLTKSLAREESRSNRTHKN